MPDNPCLTCAGTGTVLRMSAGLLNIRCRCDRCLGTGEEPPDQVVHSAEARRMMAVLEPIMANAVRAGGGN